MTLRSVPETIKSLRATLKQLEQTTDAARDSIDFAWLKGIFLKRIAELEIERIRTQADRRRRESPRPSKGPHVQRTITPTKFTRTWQPRVRRSSQPQATYISSFWQRFAIMPCSA
jgi:hypothetical protein